MSKLSALTLKRLNGELKDLIKNKFDYLQAVQDENNILVFYFLFKGLDDSDYKGGYYLGKILLDPSYPKRAVDFIFLTPNGRFLVNQKLCLSNTGYHQDTWPPLWNIRNMLNGLYSVFVTDDTNGLSHIRETTQSRQVKASASHEFNKRNYPEIYKRFTQFVNQDLTLKTDEQVDVTINPINEKSSKKEEQDNKENVEQEKKKDVEQEKKESEKGVQKRRGRPPKKKVPSIDSGREEVVKQPRRRGRPPKNVQKKN